MIHFGFSYTGLIFLLMLFIPNILWTKHKPKNYEKYVENENKILLFFERIGEILVCGISLIFSDFNLRELNIWSVWFIFAVVAMLLYEAYWIRYFHSKQEMTDFYSSFLGIPVAGASLPVAAFFFLGIYGANFFMLAATIVLGIGHIGIHLSHRREVSANKKKKILLLILLVMIFGLLTTIIGIRNYHAIRGCVNSSNGIEEEGYIDLCGQKQYYLIRGENVNNPVIIWIHGGPASPDTMETYAFSNYLKDDYTVVAWNQRGCGRTYYKNRDADPYNETATFEQAQADLDALVCYVCDRFHQQKVILVGHSYGTMVGSKYAIEHPEKMVAAFENYQSEPSLENMLALRNYVSPYHQAKKESNYILTALTSPYLGVNDVLWFGKQLGSLADFIDLNQQLFDYISSEDVYAYGTEFQIPVGFISGSCDWITPVKYTEDYYNTITAPKKEMELIDGWGHTVPMESPEEFADALIQVLNEIMQ